MTTALEFVVVVVELFIRVYYLLKCQKPEKSTSVRILTVTVTFSLDTSPASRDGDGLFCRAKIKRRENFSQWQELETSKKQKKVKSWGKHFCFSRILEKTDTRRKITTTINLKIVVVLKKKARH